MDVRGATAIIVSADTSLACEATGLLERAGALVGLVTRAPDVARALVVDQPDLVVLDLALEPPHLARLAGTIGAIAPGGAGVPVVALADRRVVHPRPSAFATIARYRLTDELVPAATEALTARVRWLRDLERRGRRAAAALERFPAAHDGEPASVRRPRAVA